MRNNRENTQEGTINGFQIRKNNDNFVQKDGSVITIDIEAGFGQLFTNCKYEDVLEYAENLDTLKSTLEETKFPVYVDIEEYQMYQHTLQALKFFLVNLLQKPNEI